MSRAKAVVAIFLVLGLSSCQAIAAALGIAGAPVSQETREKAQKADEAGWSFFESLIAGLLGLGGVAGAAKGTQVVVRRRRAKQEACATPVRGPVVTMPKRVVRKVATVARRAR